MSGAAQPEPSPKRGRQDVADLVLADVQARVEMGYQKYGTKLQTFNGRDALWDAYQEVIDLAMYLRQEIAEREVIATDAGAGNVSRAPAAGDGERETNVIS